MRRALLMVLVGLAAASCGTVDTDKGDYAGMWTLRGDGFHIHYANPPWVDVPAGTTYGTYQPLLWISPVYYGVAIDQSHSVNSYLLLIEPVSGSAASTIAALKTTATSLGEVLDFDVRAFRTSAGDLGFEFGSHGGQLEAGLPTAAQKVVANNHYTVQARRVAVDGTTGAFVITVVAIYPLDTPEMSYMLESFAPRPAADDGGMPR